jgi:hypothetical protein
LLVSWGAVSGGDASDCLEKIELACEQGIRRVVRLVRRHIVVGVFSRDFRLDRQKIADGMDHRLGYVSDLAAELLNETVKEVPRPCLDTNVLVVNQSYKILQDLGNIVGVRFEDYAVANTNLHVLQKNRRMREAGDA